MTKPKIGKPKIGKFSVQEDTYLVQARNEGISFGEIGKKLGRKSSACRYRHDSLCAPITHNQRSFVISSYKKNRNTEKSLAAFYRKYNKSITVEEFESIVAASKIEMPLAIQRTKEYPCCWHNCRFFALPSNSYCYIHQPKK